MHVGVSPPCCSVRVSQYVSVDGWGIVSLVFPCAVSVTVVHVSKYPLRWGFVIPYGSLDMGDWDCSMYAGVLVYLALFIADHSSCLYRKGEDE